MRLSRIPGRIAFVIVICACLFFAGHGSGEEGKADATTKDFNELFNTFVPFEPKKAATSEKPSRQELDSIGMTSFIQGTNLLNADDEQEAQKKFTEAVMLSDKAQPLQSIYPPLQVGAFARCSRCEILLRHRNYEQILSDAEWIVRAGKQDLCKPTNLNALDSELKAAGISMSGLEAQCLRCMDAALYYAGLANQSMRRLEKALSYYNEFLKQARSIPPDIVYQYRARIYYDLEKYQEALADIDRAIQTNGSADRYLLRCAVNLGIARNIEQARGARKEIAVRLHEAEQDCTRVLEKDPENQTAQGILQSISDYSR